MVTTTGINRSSQVRDLRNGHPEIFARPFSSPLSLWPSILCARIHLAGGEAPIKCITFLSVFGYKSALISTPFAIQVENSSDLGMGRRPKSESDEFLSCIVKVIEISTGYRFDFLPSSANFLGAPWAEY